MASLIYGSYVEDGRYFFLCFDKVWRFCSLIFFFSITNPVTSMQMF
jgi:hypothetical protein